jgi:hypothetical protein
MIQVIIDFIGNIGVDIGAVLGGLILGVAINLSLRFQLFSYTTLGTFFTEATGLSTLIWFFRLYLVFLNFGLALCLISPHHNYGSMDMVLTTDLLTSLAGVSLLTSLPICEKVKSINLDPFFVTGFSDAECSFVVGIYKNSDYKTSRQVYSVFEIGLSIRDLALLKQIQSFFGCGKIRLRKDCAVFFVKSQNDLINIIIPHFVKYPLLTQKRADFELFKQIVEMMIRKEHLTLDGLRKIVSIKASLNQGVSGELKKAFADITPVPRSIIPLMPVPDPA